MGAPATKMTSQSIAATIASVRTRYAAARKQLRDSETEELQRLQLKCGAVGHRWKWHQVAGDGRFCEICDAQDHTGD